MSFNPHVTCIGQLVTKCTKKSLTTKRTIFIQLPTAVDEKNMDEVNDCKINTQESRSILYAECSFQIGL